MDAVAADALAAERAVERQAAPAVWGDMSVAGRQASVGGRSNRAAHSEGAVLLRACLTHLAAALQRDGPASHSDDPALRSVDPEDLRQADQAGLPPAFLDATLAHQAARRDDPA